MNVGSEPPSRERCIQSKFNMTKKAATHQPQSRDAKKHANKEEPADTITRDGLSGTEVILEINAVR